MKQGNNKMQNKKYIYMCVCVCVQETTNHKPTTDTHKNTKGKESKHNTKENQGQMLKDRKENYKNNQKTSSKMAIST